MGYNFREKQMAEITPAERERLVKLNEELGESMERMGALMQTMGKASQTISKVLLHGYTVEHQGKITYDNRADLMREVGDVHAAVDLMVEAGDFDREVIEAQRNLKRGLNTRYMHHQPDHLKYKNG